MTWARSKNPGLLASAHTSPCEWWLVYGKFENPGFWRRLLGRVLKPGFEHVFALKRDGRIWIVVNMNVAYVDVEVVRSDLTPQEMFPDCIIQRVVSYRRMKAHRWPWIAGPITCVELVKSVLGIPNFFLWTPYQLHKLCSKGVLRWDRHQSHRSQPQKRSSWSADNWRN